MKVSKLLLVYQLLVCFLANGQNNQANNRNYFEDSWKPRVYNIPQDFKTKVETNFSELVNITINVADTLGKVLPTQFGANTTFRNGDGMLFDSIRFPMYQKSGLGSFRFPAGSGSNKYFYDENIPSEFLIDLNPISGLQSSALKVENFAKFVDSLGSEATVVVNYFYARYGKTPEGTREARVLQAANYAAGFVRKLNLELGANIKNWEIGNECYGPWEEGYNVNGSIVTGKEYGEDFRVFAEKMKEVDPTIKVGAVLYTKDTDWNPQVVNEVQNHADFFIIHDYFTSEKDATIENILGSVGKIEANMNYLEQIVEQNTNYTLDHFPVTLTEFNCRGPHTTTMVNGIFFAQILGELIKNNIGLATTWVSEWKWKPDLEPKAFLAVDDPAQDDYTARPTYMTYHFYGKTFGDHLINSVSNKTDVNTYASRFNSGEIGVVIVNPNAEAKAIKINVENLTKYKLNTAHWYEVYANSFNAGDKKFYINGESGTTPGGGPLNFNEVLPYKKDFSINDTLVIPGYSMNYIVLAGNTTNNIDNQHNKSTTIYPNPVNNNIFIDTQQKPTAYAIYNLQGQLLWQSNTITNSINVQHLKSGHYILKLISPNTIESMNFIKI